MHWFTFLWLCFLAFLAVHSYLKHMMDGHIDGRGVDSRDGTVVMGLGLVGLVLTDLAIGVGAHAYILLQGD